MTQALGSQQWLVCPVHEGAMPVENGKAGPSRNQRSQFLFDLQLRAARLPEYSRKVAPWQVDWPGHMLTP